MRGKVVILGKAFGRHSPRALSVFFCVAILCIFASALNPGRAVNQFYHTTLTIKDGVPGQITALAQTTDGYLWVGTAVGLYSFDGVRFKRFVSPSGDGRQQANDVQSLFAPSTGGLWIGSLSHGVSFLKDGQLTNYSENEGFPADMVSGFASDEPGIVWAACYTGLFRFDGSKWQKIEAEWNYPAKSARSVFFDRGGTLWVATGETLVYLLPGTKSFQPSGITAGWVGQIAEAPGGETLWVTDVFGSVQTFSKSGNVLTRNDLEIEVESAGLIFDKEGSLWIASLGDGIRRVPFPERLKDQKIKKIDRASEIFTQKDGLSADYVWPVLEDREGNIWFGTSGGLDCFRHGSLVPAEFPSGTHDFALAAGNDGTIWTGSTNRPLMRLQNGIVEFKSVEAQITCAYRDDDGLIWLGGTSGIWRIAGEEITKIAPLPNGVKVQVQAITKTRDGTLWVSAIGQPLLKLSNGVWTTFKDPVLPEKEIVRAALTDTAGRLWLGYRQNRVFMIDGENIRSFSSESGLNVGEVRALGRGASGRIWIGGELGLAFFDQNRFQMVTAATREKAFNGITAIIETADAGVWLHGDFGILHIPPPEIQKVTRDPQYQVFSESLNYLDGLFGEPSTPRPFPSAIMGTDGRLWFATSSGVVWLDPNLIEKNSLPPPVSIEAFNVDNLFYSTFEDLQLPAHSAHIQIDYNGLSLTIPEKVRFRYKLEGADEDWQEAGSRRQAFYTNLAPGKYRFQVIAANNDGVWNETGATINFTIAPAFYQTLWFRLANLILALILVGFILRLLYSRRISQATGRLKAGFEERLAERNRISQELHDTLLQGFLGVTMRLQAISNLLPAKPEKSKEDLDNVLEQIDGVLEEGRRAIWDIHSSTVTENDLVKAFTLAGEDLNKTYPANFSLTIEGESRSLHSLVRDEVYRIGREALTNAFRHSKATKIEVGVEYAPKYLRIFVLDNGCGISPDILSSGRVGHLGFSGMRENAEKIGAELKISSRVESGTEVQLVVPHQVAFKQKLPVGFLKRLSHLFDRKDRARNNGK